jgi:hypothetical protein
MTEGLRIHVQTYAERDERGWWCVCDIGQVLADLGWGTVEEVHPLRVGPWPSRQVARQELRGEFRRLVLGAFADYSSRHGGTVERFSINVSDEPGEPS